MHNESNNEIITEFDLFIVKIICLSNNQVNATFNDNSAIVIHPGYNYITYFHSDNTKSNMNAAFLLKQHSIDVKMNLLVSVFNLFSEGICPHTSKYIADFGLNCDFIESSTKIEKAYWINEDSFYEINEAEYYLINSHDGNTKLFLFNNLRIIKVEYPQSCQLKQKAMSHIKICKFYSINTIPNCWMLPLLMIVNKFGLQLHLKGFEIVDFNKANVVNNEYVTSLPNSQDGILQQGYLTDIQINPLAFIYHKTLSVKFIYTRNYTYLVNQYGDIDIINNEYPYMIIYSKQLTEVLSYQENPQKDEPKTIHIDTYYRVFQEDTNQYNSYNEIIVEIVNIKKYGNITQGYNKTYGGVTQQQQEKTITSPNEFIFAGNDLHLFREIKGVGEFLSYKNKAVKGNFIDRTVIKINPDQEYVYLLNKYGIHLLLRLEGINKDNEYFYYVKMTMDYYTQCFFPENYKAQLNDMKMINYCTEASMRKIEVSDYVMFNKLKQYSDEYVYYKQPTSDDIMKLLKKNEETLSDIRSIKK